MTLLEEAESLILHQFAKSSKLKALVRCLVRPFQEALNAMESLHHGGYIKHASGHRLDVLGEIVGQPRRDMSDDDYRAWIDVGIKLNDCSGTAEDIFAILALLYRSSPRVLMYEYKPNELIFALLARPKAPLNVLFDIIKSAAPVTTMCHFIRAESPSNFKFDVSPFTDSCLAEFF
jgi:hypothetical protein